MSPKKSIFGSFVRNRSIEICVRVLLIIAVLLIMLPSLASASIARISSFKGEVMVQSGDTVMKVKAPAYQVQSGDIVLTKQGEAHVTFVDGGVVKINPFTQIMIQERKEESGILFFKKTETARRITCYLGKLWFKSGLSGTRNYLQSPTAVAGVRGSDGDMGYDPVKLQTYLNMYSGEAAVVGNVVKGFFENPGITTAAKSIVYQSLVQASIKTEQAKATGKLIDQAQAKVDVLKVVKEAATILVQNNPDATVKQQAQVANAVADAGIAAASARVSLEQIKESKKQKDPEKVKKAEEAVKKADDLAKEAKRLADANLNNIEKIKEQAAAAEKSASDAKEVQQAIAPTTVAPTTVAPTTTEATTVSPTTTVEATTTAEVTTTVQTTTSTTSSTSSSVKPCPSPPCI